MSTFLVYKVKKCLLKSGKVKIVGIPFSPYQFLDIPILGITLKADGGDMDVLCRIGMLTIQAADDRIFLPENPKALWL